MPPSHTIPLSDRQTVRQTSFAPLGVTYLGTGVSKRVREYYLQTHGLVAELKGWFMYTVQEVGAQRGRI